MHLIGLPALKKLPLEQMGPSQDTGCIIVGGGGNCLHNVIGVNKTALAVLQPYFQNILRNRSQVTFIVTFSIRVKVRNVSDDEGERRETVCERVTVQEREMSWSNILKQRTVCGLVLISHTHWSVTRRVPSSFIVVNRNTVLESILPKVTGAQSLNGCKHN